MNVFFFQGKREQMKVTKNTTTKSKHVHQEIKKKRKKKAKRQGDLFLVIFDLYLSYISSINGFILKIKYAM